MAFDEEIRQINERKLEEMLKQNSAERASPKPSGKPIDMTDADFHQVVRSYPLMVVDFWAPWCGPCRVVSPVLEELSQEMAGKAVFGKVNVDDNPATATEFGIQGIPTIMIFKNGEPVDGLVGAAPKSMIEDRIRPHMGDSQKPSPYQ
jgi:thioredoxin 1